MSRNTIPFLAAAFAVLLSVPAFAQPVGPMAHKGSMRPHAGFEGGPGGEGGHGGMMGPGAAIHHLGRCLLESPDLGLSKEQRVQVFSILDDLRTQAHQKKTDLRAGHQEFLKAFADPAVKNDELKKKAKDNQAQMTAEMDAGIDAALKIRALLTPDQLKKLPAACKPGFEHHPGGLDNDQPPPAE